MQTFTVAFAQGLQDGIVRAWSSMALSVRRHGAPRVSRETARLPQQLPVEIIHTGEYGTASERVAGLEAGVR